MSQAIDWAKSPEALEATKRVFNNVIDLVSIMAKMAQGFIDMSPTLMHVVMSWAKLQIYAAPILIVTRALRALSNIGGGLVEVMNFFRGLGGLTTTGILGAFAPILTAVAGAAVLGGMALYNMHQENQAQIEATKEAMNNWATSMFMANGYLTKGIDPAARYLQLVYDKQLSANDKVAEYIRLRKEEMGQIGRAHV